MQTGVAVQLRRTTNELSISLRSAIFMNREGKNGKSKKDLQSPKLQY